MPRKNKATKCRLQKLQKINKQKKKGDIENNYGKLSSPLPIARLLNPSFRMWQSSMSLTHWVNRDLTDWVFLPVTKTTVTPVWRFLTVAVMQTFMRRVNWKSSAGFSLPHRKERRNSRQQAGKSGELTLGVHSRRCIVGNTCGTVLPARVICLSTSFWSGCSHENLWRNSPHHRNCPLRNWRKAAMTMHSLPPRTAADCAVLHTVLWQAGTAAKSCRVLQHPQPRHRKSNLQMWGELEAAQIEPPTVSTPKAATHAPSPKPPSPIPPPDSVDPLGTNPAAIQSDPAFAPLETLPSETPIVPALPNLLSNLLLLLRRRIHLDGVEQVRIAATLRRVLWRVRIAAKLSRDFAKKKKKILEVRVKKNETRMRTDKTLEAETVRNLGLCFRHQFWWNLQSRLVMRTCCLRICGTKFWWSLQCLQNRPRSFVIDWNFCQHVQCWRQKWGIKT